MYVYIHIDVYMCVYIYHTFAECSPSVAFLLPPVITCTQVRPRIQPSSRTPSEVCL